MSLSRREFLKVSGGALAGTVTGCVTVGKVPEWPAAGEDSIQLNHRQQPR